MRNTRMLVIHRVVQRLELSPTKTSTTTSEIRPRESFSSLNCTRSGKTCPPNRAWSSLHPNPREVHMYGNLGVSSCSRVSELPRRMPMAVTADFRRSNCASCRHWFSEAQTHPRCAHQHAPKRPKSTTLSPSALRTLTKHTVFLIGAESTEMKKSVHPITAVSLSVVESGS